MSAPPGPSPRVLALALALATAALFWPATRNDFVNLDDPDYYTANVVVQKGLTAEGLVWAFQAGHAGNWHPVTWLSHMADAEMFGNKPAGPHAVNVAWHSVNTALVFLLLAQLTGSRWRSALVAALFAVHPVHVESVAWISERKDVLSAFFGLLTLLAYARYVAESKIQGPRSKIWYGVALGCFALGLMSKPMLVTWPFVLLLLDYWPLQRWVKAGKDFPPGAAPVQPGTRNAGLGTLLWEKLPFFALVVISCVVTVLAQERGGAVHSLADTSLGARVGNAIMAYARYLEKICWPVNLAVPYPHPGHWPLAVVLACAAGLAAITLGCFLLRRRWPAGAMGWAWFIGTLVPVIGLVQVGSQAMADRYTYLPSIGLFIALVWGGGEFGRRMEVGGWKMTGLMATAAVAMIGALSWRTVVQIRVWQNSETLFTHAVRATEGNYIAYYNLGHHYQDLGRRAEAIANYQRTTELKPQYPDAWNNLGVLKADERKFDEALPYFRNALKHKPADGEFRTNVVRCLVLLGKERARGGQMPEAVTLLREAAELLPQNFEAQNALGSALALSGDVAAAVEHFRAALAVKPDSAAAHLNLGRALTALGQPAEAETHLRRAAELMKREPE